MFDFTYYSPTTIHFGKNKMRMLPGELTKYAARILIVYGKASIKKNGIYKDVIKHVEKTKIHYWELPGVQPNPRLSLVREGITLCKEHAIDFILAVGGGSVIDSAKAIAAGACLDSDIWDNYASHTGPREALPIGTILTVAATGSEMNGNSVITNEENQEKRSCGSPVLIPKFSILNPEYTISVDPQNTAAGIVDIIAHILESYLSPIPNALVQDHIAAALMRVCLSEGPKVMVNPHDYTARANLMWASSLALNGLIGRGKLSDWTCHAIEHEISGLYDISHGVGLAILLPHYMRVLLNDENRVQFRHMAQHVCDIDPDLSDAAERAIDAISSLIHSFGLPQRLSECRIDAKQFELIASSAVKIRGTVRHYTQLSREQILNILERSL